MAIPLESSPVIAVELYCSDADCTAVGEAVGPLAEIECLLCDCEYALVIAREWEVGPVSGGTLELALH